jgi:hypothetical protein
MVAFLMAPQKVPFALDSGTGRSRAYAECLSVARGVGGLLGRHQTASVNDIHLVSPA